MRYSASFLRWFVGLLFLSTFLYACGGGGGSDDGVPPAVAMAVPASITADAGKARVTLNWSNVTGATHYTLYYATAPGVSKSSSKFTDVHSMYVMRDLNNDQQYYFAVAAVGPDGEGGLSAEVSATPSATPPPPAPVEVKAMPQNGQVQLSWQPGFEAPAGASYTIYYSTSPNLSKATASKFQAAVSPQIIAGLNNGTAYYFAVVASNANGDSTLSYVTGATPVVMPPPPAPGNVKAQEGNGSITVSWTASAGAADYHIYYGTDFGVTKANGTKVGNVSSPYVIPGLTNKTAYFIVVTAVGNGGESPESDKVSATPLAVTPANAMLAIPATPSEGYQRGDNVQDPLAPAPYALPVHTVKLDAFYLAKYETTYAEWVEVHDWALANGYDFDRPGSNGAYGIGTHMPVTKVSFNDVVKWLNARSEKEGRTPVYYTATTLDAGSVLRSGSFDLTNAHVKWDADGYRLPTDAEWEWAARGGLVGKLYPWGDDLSPLKANYDRGTSTSVGSYDANGYGLHDMAGNVWEWVWDREATAYDGVTQTNPRGNDTGFSRTRRGGSYVYGERYLRNFDKMFRDTNYNGPYFGFRVASSQLPSP